VSLLQEDARALMKGGTGMRWSRSLLLLNRSPLTLASLHRVWPHDAGGSRGGSVGGGSGEREAETARVPVGGAGRKAVVGGGGGGADRQGKCSKFFAHGAAVSARAPSAEAADPAFGMDTGHRVAASSSSASCGSSLLSNMPGFSSSVLGAHRGGGGEGAGGSAAGGVGRGGGGPVDLRTGGLHMSAAQGRGGGGRESVPSPLSVGTQGHAHASHAHASPRGPGAGVSGGLQVAAKPLPSIPRKKQPSAVAVTVEKSGSSSSEVGHKQAPNGET